MGSPISKQIFAGVYLDHAADWPVYLQLSDIILVLIKKGKLRSGQKLPRTRDVAVLTVCNSQEVDYITNSVVTVILLVQTIIGKLYLTTSMRQGA
jgi:hypothetical protein